jgi:hypothetical protein
MQPQNEKERGRGDVITTEKENDYRVLWTKGRNRHRILTEACNGAMGKTTELVPDTILLQTKMLQVHRFLSP